MRRIVKRILQGLAGLLVAFGALIVSLGVTTPEPRGAAGWQRLPDMPRPRGEVASAVSHPPSGSPKLFVIGGIGGLGSTTRDVHVYDAAASEWNRAPSLPDGRHHAAAAGIGGTVYVSGGAKRATNWKPERNLWSLSAGARAWTLLPALPEGRMGHQMVAIQGRLYLIGGRGGAAVLIYNAARKEWVRGASMPAPRDHLAAVVVGESIYAIGGRDDNLLARVDVYDSAADTWERGPDLPEPMSAMAAGLLFGGIHVVGGEDPSTFGGGVIDRHFQLDLETGEWTGAARPILVVHGAAAGAIDGRLLVAGGARRQGSLSVLGWTGLTQSYQAKRPMIPV